MPPEATVEAPATPPVVEAPAPVVEAPPAPEPPTPTDEVTPDVIAEFNKNVEAELEPEEAAAEDEAEEPVEEEAPVDEEKPEGEETTDEPAAEEEEPVAFSLDDAPEAYEEKKKAVLEAVDLSEAPAIQALIDHQDAVIAKQGEVLGQFEAVANKDTIIKFASAVNSLYDTQIDEETGAVVVNAEPLVSLFKTDFKDEFRPIAEAVLGADSSKYEGASVLEEILVDNFGAEKADKMIGYGFHNAPLPAVPAQLHLPAGVDEKNKEAYWRLPEVERFEIQSLVDEVLELEKEMRDEDLMAWRKEEIGQKLADIRPKLDGKIGVLNDIQAGLDATRSTQERTARQQEQQAIRFRSDVNTDYNGELFEMAEGFAADLAPRLTYADADTQLPQARNMLSRVNNALGFIINRDGTFEADPMADFYAKQLSEEGVKYDFAKGRELLQRHYRSVEKLKALTSRSASPQAIEVATKEKNRLMYDIKVEQKALLGQISTRYVKSNGAALSKQVETIKAKKQAVRAITSGKPATRTTPKPVKDEMAEYNRRVAAETGEELYEAYHA